MNQDYSCKKLLWIDCAKFVAVLAVIIDHLQTVGYANRGVINATSFSVSVFVFLSGITGYCSIQRHQNRNQYAEVFRRVLSIVFPYMGATLIYQLVFERFFDLTTYLKHLVSFDISAPFYFVTFYIQLVFISPLLFRLINQTQKMKMSKINQGVILLFSVVIASLSIYRTHMTDAYGAGKHLFGGTFLVIYLLGMICAHHKIYIMTKKTLWIVLVVSLLCTLGLYVYIYIFVTDISMAPILLYGLNPPGLLIICYSISVIALLFSIFSLIELNNVGFLISLEKKIAYLGSYSLYIFLYHEFAMRLCRFALRLVKVESNIAMIPVYIFLMVGVPVVIRKCVKWSAGIWG